MTRRDRNIWCVAVSVAAVATVVLAALNWQAGASWRGFGPSPPVNAHPVWTISPNSAERAYATREGRMVTLRPCGACFQLPAAWVERYDSHCDNLHLSPQELKAVATGGGSRQDELVASVCNGLFAFDRCAVHAGGAGWGAASVSWNDLQLRVYDLSEPAEYLETCIDAYAARQDGPHDPRQCSLACDRELPWRRSRICFGWSDSGGFCLVKGQSTVDIRLQRFGERTIAFVFMSGRAEQHDDAIAEILASFHWPD
jgi:hypothetical protein